MVLTETMDRQERDSMVPAFALYQQAERRSRVSASGGLHTLICSALTDAEPVETVKI